MTSGILHKPLFAAALAAAVIGVAAPARAQTYPSRSITLVVPFPPGGGVDALARIVAEKLSGALRQNVVVDNRSGGGGTVGTRAVAKADPDGHTLLLGHTGTISINPSLYANAGYDPRKDFAFGVLPPALGNIASGNLRALAVTAGKRFSLLPEVPTAAESGLPGFEAVLHYGLLAPAGTPQPIVDRLNKELRALAETDQVKERIQHEGGDSMTSSPAEYATDIDQEERKWAALIRKLNLKVE